MKKKWKQTIMTCIVATMCISYCTFSARLFFTPAEQKNYAPDCPITLDVYVDTQGEKTMGTEFIIPYDKNHITLLGFVPTDIYNLPIGVRVYDTYIYYSAMNVDATLFAGFGKIGTLYIKARPGLQETHIEFLIDTYSSGSFLDTNVLNEASYDILQSVGGAYITFDQTKKCTFDMRQLSGFARYKDFASPDEGMQYWTEKIDEVRGTTPIFIQSFANNFGYIVGIVLICSILLILTRKRTGDKGGKYFS